MDDFYSLLEATLRTRVIGIWSQNLRSRRPRGVSRVGVGITNALLSSDSREFEYFLVEEVVWHAGMMLFRIDAVVTGDSVDSEKTSEIPPRRFEPPSFFDVMLSFECYEDMWQWPLNYFGIKTACVIHDLIPFRITEGYTSENASRYYRILSKVVDTADTLICVSHSTYSDLIALFPQARERAQICYIGHGSSRLREAAAGMNARDQKQASANLLMVGTVERRKNFHAVLNAVPEIVRGLGKRRLRIVFAGDAEGRRELVLHHDLAFERANALADLAFVDFVPDELLAQLYHQADVVVFPSLWEGFGIPILEALSFGVSVVASDVSSHPEIGRSHVRYCDPYVPAEIAAKIIEAFNVEGNMGAWEAAAGRLWASRFSWNRAAIDYERIFVGLIDESPTPPSYAKEVAEETHLAVCPRAVALMYCLPISHIFPTISVAAQALIAHARARDPSVLAALILLTDSKCSGLEALYSIVSAIIEINVDRPALAIGVINLGNLKELSESQRSLLTVLINLCHDSYNDGRLVSGGPVCDKWPLAETIITVDAGTLDVIPINDFRYAIVMTPREYDCPSKRNYDSYEALTLDTVRQMVVNHSLVRTTEDSIFREVIAAGSLTKAFAGKASIASGGAITTSLSSSFSYRPLERDWSILIIAPPNGSPEDWRLRSVSSAFSNRLIAAIPGPVGSPISRCCVFLQGTEQLRLLTCFARVIIAYPGSDGLLDKNILFASNLGKHVIVVGDSVEPLSRALFGFENMPSLDSALVRAAYLDDAILGHSQNPAAYVPGALKLVGLLQALSMGKELQHASVAECWLLGKRAGMSELLDRLETLGVIPPNTYQTMSGLLNGLSHEDASLISDKLRDILWIRLQNCETAYLEHDCANIAAAGWPVPERDLQFISKAATHTLEIQSQDFWPLVVCSPVLSFTIETATATSIMQCEVDGISCVPLISELGGVTRWFVSGAGLGRSSWIPQLRILDGSGQPIRTPVSIVVDLVGVTDPVTGDKCLGLMDFYETEFTDVGGPSHRWSGPGLRSKIEIPMMVLGECIVCIKLANLGAHESSKEVMIAANGVPAVVNTAGGEFVIRLPAPINLVPRLAIDIAVDCSFSSEHDARRMGIAIGRVLVCIESQALAAGDASPKYQCNS